MPAKFVIKNGTTGKFRFALHAANGGRPIERGSVPSGIGSLPS